MAEPVVNAKNPADAFMKNMLDAIKAGSYPAFIADGTPKMKDSTGKSAFGVASAHFAGMLRKGYKTTYVATLRKTGRTLHLWKLEPADAPEDFEIKLALKGGKVDGFWID